MKAFLSFLLSFSFLVSAKINTSEQASESIKTNILQKNGQVFSYNVFNKQIFKIKTIHMYIVMLTKKNC